MNNLHVQIGMATEQNVDYINLEFAKFLTGQNEISEHSTYSELFCRDFDVLVLCSPDFNQKLARDELRLKLLTLQMSN